MHRRKQNAIGSPSAKEFHRGTAFLESWPVARSLKETITSKCRGMLPKRCRRENLGADDAMVLPTDVTCRQGFPQKSRRTK